MAVCVQIFPGGALGRELIFLQDNAVDEYYVDSGTKLRTIFIIVSFIPSFLRLIASYPRNIVKSTYYLQQLYWPYLPADSCMAN
jgi:hypothetical protein